MRDFEQFWLSENGVLHDRQSYSTFVMNVVTTLNSDYPHLVLKEHDSTPHPKPAVFFQQVSSWMRLL